MTEQKRDWPKHYDGCHKDKDWMTRNDAERALRAAERAYDKRQDPKK